MEGKSAPAMMADIVYQIGEVPPPPDYDPEEDPHTIQSLPAPSRRNFQPSTESVLPAGPFVASFDPPVQKTRQISSIEMKPDAKILSRSIRTCGKELKILSTRVGTMGSIFDTSAATEEPQNEDNDEKDSPQKKELRFTINNMSKQEPLSFYAKHRWFFRGSLYCGTFLSIYVVLVIHNFFISRSDHVFPDNLNKLTIRISTKNFWSPAPTKLATDQCILRFVNSCSDSSQDCFRKTMVGYGRSKVIQSESGESAEVELISNTQWNAMPESWHNKVFCEFMIILPPTVDVEVMGDKIYVVAEDISMKSLYISGKNKGSNADLHAGLIRINVVEDLTIFGGTGGVILEDITVGKSLTGNVLGGSIDVTTKQAPGAFIVTTESRTACIVGANMTSIKSSIITGVNNTYEVVTGTFGCVGACATYNLKASGKGSIGVHWNGAPSLGVFAGAGFGGRNFYTGVDHSEITSGKATYAYIQVIGLGFMKGGPEVVWTNNKVWWSFNSEVTYFAAFSLFVVMPDMARYQMAVSFCPAHSGTSGPSKDLFLPLEQGMAGAADKNGNKGWWIIRNTGSLRDAMKSNKVRITSLISKAEKYIPDCSYCGDWNLWKDGYWVGSIGDPVKDFPRKCVGLPLEVCSPENFEISDQCKFFSANQWTLVEKGSTECMPGVTVASLMSSDIVFPDEYKKCWTSARGQCNGVTDYFKVWSSAILFYLSTVIGCVLAFSGTSVFYWVFLKNRVSTSILGLLVTHRGTFELIKETFDEAKYFAVEEPIHEDKLVSTHDTHQSLLQQHVDLTKVSVLYFTRCYFYTWLFQGTRPVLKDILRGWVPSVQEAASQDFVSHSFVKVCRWLLDLKVDPNTLEITDSAGNIPKGSILVYLPDMSANDFLSEIEVHDEKNTREKYTSHKIEESPRVTLERFEAYRQKVRVVMFVMQNLIVTFSIWFLTERPMLGVQVEEIDPKVAANNPAYFSLARELYYNRVRSMLGEFQTLIVHTLLPFVPSLLFYCFSLSWFYIRAAEYGVTDLYPGSGNYLIQEVASDAIISICAIYWGSLMVYYGPAWNTWDLPIRTGDEVIEKIEDSGCCSGTEDVESSLTKEEELKRTYERFDKRYTWLNRERRFISLFACLTLASALFYTTMVAVWFMLGMFLDPQRVAPFAVGILSSIAHVYSLYKRKTEKYEEIGQSLKKQMIEFNLEQTRRQVDMIQVRGHWISSNGPGGKPIKVKNYWTGLSEDMYEKSIPKNGSPEKRAEEVRNKVKNKLNQVYYELSEREDENLEKTADLEIISWLRRYKISGSQIFFDIVLSTLLLVGIFLFLYVGMEVFQVDKSDTIQAVVNSSVIIAATIGVNKQSSGSHSRTEIERVVARIMAAYKMDKSKGGFSVDLHEKVSRMISRADRSEIINVNEGESYRDAPLRAENLNTGFNNFPNNFP